MLGMNIAYEPLNYDVQLTRLDTAWEVIVIRRQGGQQVCRALIRSRDQLGALLELLWL